MFLPQSIPSLMFSRDAISMTATYTKWSEVVDRTFKTATHTIYPNEHRFSHTCYTTPIAHTHTSTQTFQILSYSEQGQERNVRTRSEQLEGGKKFSLWVQVIMFREHKTKYVRTERERQVQVKERKPNRGVSFVRTTESIRPVL